jgi:hypothetical protein
MENKTSTIVIANVTVFLLYFKFGTMAFWVPAAAGFCVVAAFIFIVLILQLYFKEFYNSKFDPFIRRVTKDKLELTQMAEEQRVILKNGFTRWENK